ncbi:MAG: insulinase family protein [Fimbriimonadaceae bacterium]
MPATSLSIQLFANAGGVGETPATHGWRHLLEHLVLKGREGKSSIDERAETQGIFITGRTYRDCMQIEITCEPEQLKQGLAFLDELLLPIDVSTETIAKEVAVMKQEIALEDDAAKLARGAWQVAYGEAGIDALGDAETMLKATPEALIELQAAHFAPENLGLLITGPVEIEKTMALASASLSRLRGKAGSPVLRTEPGAKRLDMPSAFGELRGTPVPGIRDSRTMAALIAAFGIASEISNSFVTYTPTSNRGLVMVGRTDVNSGVGFLIDELDDDRKATLFNRGRTLALRWIERYKRSPSSNSSWRGMLLCQDKSLRAETLVETMAQVSYAQYLTALTEFGKEKAIIVVGDRK